MITDSFDSESPALITRQALYGPSRHLCDICIVTFSQNILKSVLERFPCEEIARIRACNGDIIIYGFDYNGLRLGIYLSCLGSAMAGDCIEESSWLIGATKYITFGSAGSLDAKATTGRYVIPTHAYRDEGMSYHYAPPADYIEIKNAARLADIMTNLNLPYVTGRCWTTDSFFRETQNQFKARVAEGCVAVDMELAGLQAVCNFYHLDLYTFLMTGDVLSGDAYDVAELSHANHELANFTTALKIACAIA